MHACGTEPCNSYSDCTACCDGYASCTATCNFSVTPHPCAYSINNSCTKWCDNGSCAYYADKGKCYKNQICCDGVHNSDTQVVQCGTGPDCTNSSDGDGTIVQGFFCNLVW